MSISTNFLSNQKELPKRVRPRDLALLFVSGISTLLIGIYHLNLTDDLTTSSFSHLISLLPVISMAYFFGVIAGQ